MGVKVKIVESPTDPSDFPLDQFPLYEVGIVTFDGVSGYRKGQPAIRLPTDEGGVIFPFDSGKSGWNRGTCGFRLRKLKPGEQVIFEGT